MFGFARILLTVLNSVGRHLILTQLVIYLGGGALFGLIGLLSGDWGLALKVCGYPALLICLTCLVGMFAMILFPSTFRQAAQEIRGTTDGASPLPDGRDQSENP